jgi:hypothetical protein
MLTDRMLHKQLQKEIMLQKIVLSAEWQNASPVATKKFLKNSTICNSADSQNTSSAAKTITQYKYPYCPVHLLWLVYLYLGTHLLLKIHDCNSLSRITNCHLIKNNKKETSTFTTKHISVSLPPLNGWNIAKLHKTVSNEWIKSTHLRICGHPSWTRGPWATSLTWVALANIEIFFSNIKYAFHFHLPHPTLGGNYLNQLAFVLCQNAFM